MIVNKSKLSSIAEEDIHVIHKQVVEATNQITTIEEAASVNALCEVYLAVRNILQNIHVDPNDDNSPLLFKTVKLDNGQLSRIKHNQHNNEYAIGFPACFLHFVEMYWNVGQYRINEGKGRLRIHFVLNRLNNGDDDVELEGFRTFDIINQAINDNKAKFPALVNRFQLKYFDQPLSFDDGLQPYWIDYEVWFNDYSTYLYKNYVDAYVVMPPFTNHSDQLEEHNIHHHEDHLEPTIEEVAGFTDIEEQA